MVRAWVALAIVLPACGRVSFDPTNDGGAGGEGYAAVVLADGPYAYYRLGDALGAATFRDSSGNNQHANTWSSLIGVIEPRAGALAGDPDTATHFFGEGNGGMGSVGCGVLPDVWALWSSDFTIEAFVDALSTPTGGFNYALVICETYQVDGFRIGWNLDRQIDVWSSEAGSSGSAESIGALRPGWTHVAIVQRGGSIEVFFDGISDGVQPFVFNAPTAAAECGFGSFHGMAADVILDELAFYASALSSQQIAAHYAASGR